MVLGAARSSIVARQKFYIAPRMCKIAQQRTHQQQIVSFRKSHHHITATQWFSFSSKLLLQSSFNMAFSSMFKAAAFLAVVIPAQAFAPASLGAKTVRSIELSSTVWSNRNLVDTKGFRFDCERFIFLHGVHSSDFSPFILFI